MKVLVQWTRQSPGNWEELDSSQWISIPVRPDPQGLVLGGQDNDPGWVHRLNVQGVEFVGDHYAVEHLADGCRVTCWWDDPSSYPAGTRFAHVFMFLPPAPDPQIGGAVNTRQQHTVYAEEGSAWWPIRDQVDVTVLPWSEFTPPATESIRHGVWVDNELNTVHEQTMAHRGWREWVE